MIEYKVIFSDRKTVSIQVTENGDVLVRAPRRYPEYKIKKIVKEHSEWIDNAKTKQMIDSAKKLDLTSDQIEKLKQLAQIKIKERVGYYSAIMGVKPTDVRITSAQKRFGSCSGKNSVCFSYLLMLYPDEAIDYVVVHELAHIRHHNHSKSFYKFISEFLPDYKNRELLLKSQQKLPDFS